MCGRYKRAQGKEALVRRFRIERVETDLFTPRYNLAPSQEALVVLLQDGARVLTSMRWGLVPAWAKDGSPGPINARAETLAQRPMFKRLLASRRCLVPADGFYEWKRIPGQKGKQPNLFTVGDGGLFAFAGIWDAWISPEGEEIRTFAIVTTEPNEVTKPVHDRMPVVLKEPGETVWLEDASRAASLLLPYAGEMRAEPVSTLVNSPGNDVPECAQGRP